MTELRTERSERKVKTQRPASTYRAARRNGIKAIRGVWRSSITPTYRPVPMYGKIYKPNGDHEVERRRHIDEWVRQEIADIGITVSANASNNN
jgi:hypothetical protein